MGIPVPRRRQSGSDSRFLSQPEPRREGRQIVSAQRNEEHSRANEDHVGRLCGLAPGGARDEGRRRTSVPRQGSIQPVLEQSGGTRPSESKATNPADELKRPLRRLEFAPEPSKREHDRKGWLICLL